MCSPNAIFWCSRRLKIYYVCNYFELVGYVERSHFIRNIFACETMLDPGNVKKIPCFYFAPHQLLITGLSEHKFLVKPKHMLIIAREVKSIFVLCWTVQQSTEFLVCYCCWRHFWFCSWITFPSVSSFRAYLGLRLFNLQNMILVSGKKNLINEIIMKRNIRLRNASKRNTEYRTDKSRKKTNFRIQHCQACLWAST